ncbi:hypothetical protein ThvES_00007710 [Thiovulum sp. ES]|nr:hypothetical protein ThvES_00007710 [Thiovulum sp. ES]
MKIFLLILPIFLNAFVETGEGTAMSKIEAYKIAVSNAKAKAQLRLNTQVETEYQSEKSVADGKVSTDISFSSKQKSIGILKLVHVFDEKT